MPRGRPLVERLFEKIGAAALDDCWPWQASCAAGYPQIWVDGKVRKAHVVIYELVIGPMPEGLELDHLCENSRCVNPWHLEPVTRLENVRRSRAAKLTTEERKAIRKSTERAVDLAKRYGVTGPTISRVRLHGVD